MQHLDGDIPVQVVVMCFPHFAHPAFADALEESIAAEDGTGLNGQAAGGGIARASGHGFVSGKASYRHGPVRRYLRRIGSVEEQ